MKKIIALTLALLTLTLCFVSCGQKAIEIIPKLPDTYEIVIIEYSETLGARETVYGLDSVGNKYVFDINGREHVYIAQADGKNYDEYLLNEETGSYMSMGTAVSTGTSGLENCYKLPHSNAVTGSYKKIDSLNLPASITQTDLIFMDTDRFEYYEVTTSGGLVYETAVEKETGIHFYTCYVNDGEYNYISKYTVPCESNYADLLRTNAQ